MKHLKVDEDKNFSLRELIRMIEHCALDLMDSAIIAGKKQDGTYMTLTEISHQNSMTAMHNDGVKLMAQTLIDELTGEEEDD